jgi:hypothetical protein
MQQTVRVTYDDGRTLEGPVGPRELVEFERKYGVSVQALASGAHVEWVYFIAYLAMKRLHKAGEHDGAIKSTFDDFLSVVADVEMVDAAGPLDETAS